MIHCITDRRGFSLVEMMTALAIVSIVMVGIYTMYFTQTQSHATQQVVVDMQQGIRLAMYLIEKEMRMAGFDPTNSGVPGIISAQRASITFSMDITGGETDGIDNDGDGNTDGSDLAQNRDGLDNDADTLVDEDDEGDETRYGDGDVNDTLEQITYSLSNDANGDGIADSLDCNLQRQYWDGAAWQPNPAADIAFDIDALNFVYLDANGNDLIDYGLNPPEVPGPQLGDIRSVQVTIVARGGQNPRQGLPGQKLDTHIYMNQQNRPADDWDIILPAQNDRFRRIILTAEVSCRNLGLP
jgi:type IV pilus assembly protein PilW